VEHPARIISGAFTFPHVAGKFVNGALNPGTVAFFAKAGFQPPEVWVYFAAGAESLTGIALVLGICTRYAALGAAAVLAVAVYALQMVKGFGWTWNTGGYEYPVFWPSCASQLPSRSGSRCSRVAKRTRSEPRSCPPEKTPE
jgi:putative oxidoreductase